jgi:hypothetical protein
MFKKTATGVAFAAGCLIALGAMPRAQAQDYNRELVTNGPQADPGDMRGHWAAHRNVVESHQYEGLLQSNSKFRQARMNKECGPITDPQLHQQCLSSFESTGSSSPDR